MKYSGVSTTTPQMPAVQKTIFAIFTLRSLFAAHREPVNADRRRRHTTTELQVRPNLRNVAEHLFQIARNRYFFHRIRQLAIDNPHPRRSARIITSDKVCAVTEELGDIETVFNLPDNLVRRLRPWLQKVISRPNPRSPSQSPRRIRGSLKPQLFRCVSIQKIRFQKSILNHDRAPSRNTFAIKRSSAEPTRHRAIIHHGDIRAGNLVSEFARQKRRSAIHRVAVDALEYM